MCGICGIIDPNGQSEELYTHAREMVYAIRHRGPDDFGIHLDQGIGLGHSRLSIQDLSSAGHQPMISDNGRFCVVYNGEIYNFKDLRAELEEKGYTHKSRSDTEVLLHAYIEWGQDCLFRLSGMFAFAIWDAQERTLFLVRDRMGIKPLFYISQGERFAFASEIKALLKLPWVSPVLCLPALGRFLQLRYNDDERTLFENILKLAPAHKLVLTPEGISISRYWRLSIPQRFEKRPYNDWLAELDERLVHSVREHLISDVPVGVFLSGGIDSNTIMSLATHINGIPPDTFSVGFSTETGRDELGNIRESKTYFGSRHHELILSPHIEDLLPRIIFAADEPLADPALVPTYLLCEMAAKEIKVILSGEGSDELFGGYERSFLMMYARHLLRNVPQRLRGIGVETLSKIPRSLLDKVFKYTSKLGDKGFERLMAFSRSIDSPSTLYLMSNAVFLPEEMSLMLNPDAAEALSGALDPRYCDSHFFSGMKEGAFLNYELRFEIETRLWADLLMKLDNASMPFSLEGRVPYLDHRLVEFSTRIPPSLKIKRTKEKWILREAAKTYLPEAIRKRKKDHFFVPIDTWLREDLADYVSSRLEPEFIKRQGIFAPAYIRHIDKSYHNGALVYARQLWNLVCFQTWFTIYIGNEMGWLDESADDDFKPQVTYASKANTS